MSKGRRWFKFSLLSLLGAVAIAALMCGLAARKLELHTDQLGTAARIAGVDRARLSNVPLRGSTGFIHNGCLTQFILEPSQGWASEAARLLGRPYHVDVVGVVLGGRNQNYKDLVDVMRLPRLRRLKLSRAEITPQVIAALAQITWLEELRFTETTVTKEEIDELKKRLPNTTIVVD